MIIQLNKTVVSFMCSFWPSLISQFVITLIEQTFLGQRNSWFLTQQSSEFTFSTFLKSYEPLNDWSTWVFIVSVCLCGWVCSSQSWHTVSSLEACVLTEVGFMLLCAARKRTVWKQRCFHMCFSYTGTRQAVIVNALKRNSVSVF